MISVKLLRDIHLALGLFCVPFLIVYGIDGVRTSHRSWFKGGSSTQKSAYQVQADEPEAIARELAEKHGVAGDFTGLGSDGDFYMQGPMAGFVVRYDAGTKTANVEAHKGGVVTTAHNLHVNAGINRVSSSSNLWGWLVLFVSGSLVLLGATGLWLWTQRLKERRLGLLFLAGSLGYCVVCFVLIATA